AAGRAEVDLGQIVDPGGGSGVVEPELVAFARPIGSRDAQNAVIGRQIPGEPDQRRARIEHCRDFRALKAERGGGALTRLRGAQLYPSVVAWDLRADDAAVVDLAAFHADRHGAARDGLVLA